MKQPAICILLFFTSHKISISYLIQFDLKYDWMIMKIKRNILFWTRNLFPICFFVAFYLGFLNESRKENCGKFFGKSSVFYKNNERYSSLIFCLSTLKIIYKLSQNFRTISNSRMRMHSHYIYPITWSNSWI